MIKVSRHAEIRIRERQGLNKKSIERMAQKAFDKGIRHEQTKGNLNKWLTSKYFVNKQANNLRIYGDYLYVFDGNTLVTVFRVPNNLLKNIDDMVRK